MIGGSSTGWSPVCVPPQYPRLGRVCVRHAAAGPRVRGEIQGAEIPRIHLDPCARRTGAQTTVIPTYSYGLLPVRYTTSKVPVYWQNGTVEYSN